MRILMISPDAPPHKGGISRLVNLLKQGLERSGHHVSIVSPKLRIRELKFSTIPFHAYSGSYDLVHVHGPTPFLSDLTLVTNVGSRIIYTHHAEVSWMSERVSEVYRRFHRFLAKRARTIIVHTRDYSSLFTGCNVVTLRLPCPIEPPEKKMEFDQKPDVFTVLYVGQFRPFKGLEMLIKAAASLNEMRFILAGEGYLKPRLMKMAKGLENVNFVNAANDDELRQIYSAAHVICLPSVNTTEAYGLVLIEGALHGCVPLASNLLGVNENVAILKGLTFNKKSLESLTNKLKMLGNDKALWTSMSIQSTKAAHNYAVSFPPELYVKRHEQIYHEVLHRDR